MITKEIQETNVIDRSQVLTEKTFSIKATAKAFKLLASNIYSDKLKALIVETYQNAYDSHHIAGQSLNKIIIHAPNSLEPYYSIRDFGTSMSHDFMMNQYTNLFYSSKSETNDQVGAFGLGRLAPFCIADSYTVTCFLGGRKRIYNIYYNNKGEPTIVLFLETDTDEQDGVEVLVPIDKNNVYYFSDKINDCFWFLENEKRPEVVGTTFAWKKKNIVLQGDNWKIFDSGDKSLAVMGCYAYPIRPESITELPEDFGSLLRVGLVLNFEVGDLECNASRQELSYNTDTCNNIIIAISKIKNELKKVVDDKFNSITNVLEAYSEWGKLFNYPGKGYFFPPSLKKVAWKNLIISSNDIEKEDGVEFYVYFISPKSGRISKKPCHSITSEDNLTIIIDDINNRSNYGRVENLCEKGGVLAIVFQDEQVKKNFYDKYCFDTAPTILMSSLPKKIRVKNIAAKIKKDEIYLYRHSYRKSRCWESFDVNNLNNITDKITNKIYYVQRSYDYYVGGGEEKDPSIIGEFVNFDMLVNKTTGKNILGIRSSALKNIRKDSRFVEFYSYTKDLVSKEWESNININVYHAYKQLTISAPTYYKSKLFDELDKKISSLKIDEGLYSLLIKLKNYFCINIKSSNVVDKEVKEIKELIGKINTRYPLLGRSGNWYQEYVKIMDFLADNNLQIPP